MKDTSAPSDNEELGWGAGYSEGRRAPEKVAYELTPKDGKEPAMKRTNRRESEVEIWEGGSVRGGDMLKS